MASYLERRSRVPIIRFLGVVLIGYRVALPDQVLWPPAQQLGVISRYAHVRNTCVCIGKCVCISACVRVYLHMHTRTWGLFARSIRLVLEHLRKCSDPLGGSGWFFENFQAAERQGDVLQQQLTQAQDEGSSLREQRDR